MNDLIYLQYNRTKTMNVRKSDQIKRLENECQFLKDKKYSTQIIDIFEINCRFKYPRRRLIKMK